MKWAFIFSVLMSFNLWARPVVLLSHFDAFDKAPFNNSERVAHALYAKLKDHPDFELRLCALSTVFDKSFAQMENCLKDLKEKPVLVLGLGESNCNFKIETMARNLDKTYGPDNEGNERRNTQIFTDGSKALGFNYPLEKMYCSLDPRSRNDLEVSNNAGTFVCNNLAYQFTHYYPEETFGFIHVPSHNCRNISQKTQMAISNLTKMIPTAVKNSGTKVLPITKNELDAIRSTSKSDTCTNEFYKRVRGIDERGLWTF